LVTTEISLARRPCNFRQTDLTRALRGALAAGIEIVRVEVRKDGTFVLVPGKLTDMASPEITDANEWDDAA
jgi:hypothetical protein